MILRRCSKKTEKSSHEDWIEGLDFRFLRTNRPSKVWNSSGLRTKTTLADELFRAFVRRHFFEVPNKRVYVRRNRRSRALKLSSCEEIEKGDLRRPIRTNQKPRFATSKRRETQKVDCAQPRRARCRWGFVHSERKGEIKDGHSIQCRRHPPTL